MPLVFGSNSIIHFSKQLILLLTACCVLLLVGCGKIELYSALPENEANDMMAILQRNGIDAEKVKNKKQKPANFALLIAPANLANAVSIFKKYGYPRERFSSIEDIFKKEGLVSSPLEERLRFIYALEQDLQETLSQIDGIITSRVSIVLPKNNPFAKNVNPASASIYIKYLPGTNISQFKSNIKLIVEKSIEGLDYNKITVVLLPSRVMNEFSDEIEWKNIFGMRLPLDSYATFIRLMLFLAFAVISLVSYISWGIFQKRRSSNAHNTPEGRVSKKIQPPSQITPPAPTSDFPPKK